ncbi:hypothetical protein [Carnobacterium funditum]|uniref:hypothetical protein n=1 Tax=Carnobacterium funditum TaxID=2752 RepID=UPI000558A696|nr:hypothetical protein [Carnobacterium funditum]
MSFYCFYISGWGFSRVITGAANTTIACFIKVIKLLGSENAIFLFLICVVRYVLSGNLGIYFSQEKIILKGNFFLSNQ